MQTNTSAAARLAEIQARQNQAERSGKRLLWNYCQANDLAWLAEYAGTLASRLNTRVTGGCCPVAEFGDVDPEDRDHKLE